ncbi:MAG TPA: GGDEF domain-containing protein [Cellvibrio sp.]|nr:GGDEF domain-containing protein [Cellvibrio sp.]
MNDKNFNSILVAAILVTALLIGCVHVIPAKQLVLLPNASARLYLFTQPLTDGTPSSEWTNNTHTAWKCTYPENHHTDYFPCAVTIDLSTSATTGLDLSNYQYLSLHLNYTGSANKVRIAIRNYNPAYSTATDNNSTKFNAIQIHTAELNKENRIALPAFVAADWWLSQYNIPLSRSAPEMDNTMVITVDFGEPIKPGIHSFSIDKLELQGDWINVEYWYLGILSLWMLGILTYAIRRLVQLNAQAKYDTRIINELSNNNQELQEETNKFRRLSTVDPLTQIYNRFGIDQIVASIAGQGHIKKPDQPEYALMIIDIDHFKRVNDQRGHDTGDKVLQHVASIIQQHLRAGDYVGRWGGEEFIVLMPGASKTTAMGLAEIIRAAIFSSQFDSDRPLVITASFGVGQQGLNEDFASCFKRTDNALYKAKAQGRNCCVYADESL